MAELMPIQIWATLNPHTQVYNLLDKGGNLSLIFSTGWKVIKLLALYFKYYNDKNNVTYLKSKCTMNSIHT